MTFLLGKKQIVDEVIYIFFKYSIGLQLVVVQNKFYDNFRHYSINM